MKKILAVIVLLAIPALAFGQDTEVKRIESSGQVLKEILNSPSSIPPSLLKQSKCVAVFPSVVKAAFIVGGSYGRGVLTCRSAKGWSAPAMMALEGGGVGFQIGGQATDFVLLVMNDRGKEGILQSKFKLGADASIAAGPVGRTGEASTDVTFKAQILSYSRSRGVFAGISLSGSTLRPDGDANEKIYGKGVTAADIVGGKKPAPPSSQALLSTLRKY